MSEFEAILVYQVSSKTGSKATELPWENGKLSQTQCIKTFASKFNNLSLFDLWNFYMDTQEQKS